MRSKDWEWFEEPVAHKTMEVVIAEEKPVNTGLLSEHGLPLWRRPTPKIIGFCR